MNRSAAPARIEKLVFDYLIFSRTAPFRHSETREIQTTIPPSGHDYPIDLALGRPDLEAEKFAGLNTPEGLFVIIEGKVFYSGVVAKALPPRKFSQMCQWTPQGVQFGITPLAGTNDEEDFGADLRR